MTAGPRGPALLQDIWLIEKLAHFDREVIPELRQIAPVGYSEIVAVLDSAPNCKPPAQVTACKESLSIAILDLRNQTCRSRHHFPC
jgi:Catalase